MAKLDTLRRKAKITSVQEQALEDQFFAKKHAPGSYEMVPLEKIDPDPDNPRKSMDPEALEHLAQSIREKGIIHPLNLLQLDNGRYNVEEGHRRFEAAKKAGQTHLPAIIIMADDLSDEEKRERQLIENLHNEDLPPVDAARAISSLQRKHNLSVRDVAEKIALKRSRVQNYLSILKLGDELLERVPSTFPVSALVEIAGMPASDRPAALDAALDSKHPFKRAQTTRKGSESAYQIKERLRFDNVAGWDALVKASLAISFEREHEPTNEELIDVYNNVMKQIRRKLKELKNE